MPMLIGSGPGSARRASAPTMRPEKDEDDQVDEQAHAWTVAPRAKHAAQRLPRSRSGAPHRASTRRRGAPMRHLGLHMRIGLAAALATCAAALAPAAASAADVSDLLPAVSPPGANDFTCKPTRGAPRARRARPRHLRGRGRQLGHRLAEVQGRRLLRLRARVRQPRHRRHRRLGRPAGALRRRGARGHRSAPGLDGRPLAGRDDAALLPQVPGRRRQGRRPRRPRALQPRHRQPRRARRGRDVLPRVRPAARRLGLPHEPQRGRRDARAPSPTRRSRRATTRSSPRTRRPSWPPARGRPTSCSRTPARPR